MSTPRMIATDLDGTLLGPDGQVSERTRAAIATASAAGVEIVAATGRSRHSAIPKLEGTDAIRWVVCSNGAMVWDRHTDAIDLHRPMDGGVAAHTLRRLRSAVTNVAIGWETPDGFGFDQEFVKNPPGIDEFHLNTGVPEPQAGTEVTKLFVTVHGLSGANLVAHFRPHMPPTVTATASGATFLETTAAGVDKATTLQLLAARFGIEATDVIAFGDQLNDLPMLAWAGTSVAVGNAQAEVLAASDSVAPTNANDGVAQTIEQFLVKSASGLSPN